ncbi:hypothetical protein ES703_30826 [subsurface metagenome]
MYEEERKLLDCMKPLFEELDVIRERGEAMMSSGAIRLVRKALMLFEDGFTWRDIEKKIREQLKGG